MSYDIVEYQELNNMYIRPHSQHNIGWSLTTEASHLENLNLHLGGWGMISAHYL